MKKIVFVIPHDVRFGFALAGVREVMTDAAGAETALSSLMQDAEIGLLVVDERLLSAMSEERFRELERRWDGVVTVIPAPVGEPLVEEDYAMRLVTRAIGYHVRLKV